MKFIKKILAVGMITIALVSFAACKNNNGTSITDDMQTSSTDVIEK